MAQQRYVKTFSEFITEAAKWDDTSKRRIDSFFVSFDKDEKYEVRDFIQVALTTLKKYNIEVDINELTDVVWKCKDKIPHNNPRKALFQCVMAYYGVDITD